MTKPNFVLVTYHHKDDQFPQVIGLFPSLGDSINAADEVAPQESILEWTITPSKNGSQELYSIDEIGTRYTISEREVVKWADWRRPG